MSIIKDHNRKNKTDPIQLDFDEEDTAVKDTSIVKGKEVVDGDLIKPFKEALKTPLTRRIIEFAESEIGFIMGVPEIMKISSFMDSLKCPELAKRFSDKTPTTVNEMMKRLDDFVRSESAFAQTELPKGETREQHRKSYFPLLEAALESSKLNHMIKDVRQRGMGNQKGDGPQQAKIINMAEVDGAAIKARLKETQTDFVGFAGEETKPLGKIELEDESKSLEGHFFIHSMMKFPTLRGIPTLVTRSVIISNCGQLEKKQVVEEEKKEEVKTKAVNVTEEILVNPTFPDQLIVIEHNLNVNASIEPKRQKRKVLAPKKSKAAARDVSEWFKIGMNMEEYVDNMVIKSNDEKILLADVVETFDNLRKINMKLNLKKCSYGVKEGMFLGYMVTSEGIGANPKKTRVLADLQSPRTLKEMQSLVGKLTALNRFLAKSAERSLPFFDTLKNITKEIKHEYKWTIEAEEAFQQIKRCIINLPFLTPSFLKETLYAYLAVSREAVTPEKDDTKEWTLFIDVASSSKGSREGLVLIGLSGIEHTYALRLTFDHTNNKEKYEALLAMIRIIRGMGIQKLNKNQKADVLSKLASLVFNHLTKDVLVEVLNERSTEGKDINTVVEEEGDNWMTSIIQCLEKGVWPEEKTRLTTYEAWTSWDLFPRLSEESNMFNLPQIIVIYNGTQFANDPFKSWCARLNIQQMNTAVAHPQPNGLVKKENKILIEGIKTRLGREKAGWVDDRINRHTYLQNYDDKGMLQRGRDPSQPRPIEGEKRVSCHPRSKVPDEARAVLQQEGPFDQF
ncbi:reverse transcriptase domain-containing protein [Tanacetum coccineum]